MKTHSFSIQRFSALLISLFLLGYLLILGKAIIIPLLFAGFLAFLLKPLSATFESKLNNRMWGIILALLSLLIVLTSIIMAFGFQLSQIIGNVDNIKQNIELGFAKMLRWAGSLLGMRGTEIERLITDNFSSWADIPAEVISTGFGSSFVVLGSFLLCLLFTFFLLLYRKSFYNFFLYQFNEESRRQGSVMIRRIENVTKEYLNGLLLVIFILATLNSIGLYLIGIKLALFWGVLGAFLAIIPYVGTILGGLLPFVYALASFGFSWQPLAVVIFYALVQSLEGNIITPKIVGKSVRINPFIAIIALVIGGMIWGVAGMILALPMVAVIKIIFANIEVLEPVSELFRDDLYQRENIFEEKYDEEKYRLRNFFKHLPSEKIIEKRTIIKKGEFKK